MRHYIFAISGILFLTGCGRPSASSSTSSRSRGFEDKPFLGLSIGMTEDEVTAAFEASGLPYQVEKDKYKDYRRQSATERGYEFDESESTLGITVKGNARLKGQNYISIDTKSGNVTSVSVMCTTREGILPVEGEKEKADQMFESLLSILKKQYGKPEHKATVEGNRVAMWITDAALVTLGGEFDWDENIFSVKTDMEQIPPGEADKMRKEMQEAFQSIKK